MPSIKDKNLEIAVLVAAMMNETVREQITPTDFTGLEREAAMFVCNTRTGPREPFVRWLEQTFGVQLENGEKVPESMLARLVRNVELRHLERTGDGKWEAVQRRFYEAVARKRELRKERD